MALTNTVLQIHYMQTNIRDTEYILYTWCTVVDTVQRWTIKDTILILRLHTSERFDKLRRYVKNEKSTITNNKFSLVYFLIFGSIKMQLTSYMLFDIHTNDTVSSYTDHPYTSICLVVYTVTNIILMYSPKTCRFLLTLFTGGQTKSQFFNVYSSKFYLNQVNGKYIGSVVVIQNYSVLPVLCKFFHVNYYVTN
jgi:hypothetical protein